MRLWPLCYVWLAAAANMNDGVRYSIANPAPGFEGKSFPFIGDYFEVRTPPMKFRYSEVFWTDLGPVDLPAEVVTLFANATIAVTGFEVDVMRKNNVTGEEESVPCYQSYNHHYGPALLSSAVELKLDHHGRPKGVDHGHGKHFEVEQVAPAPPGVKLVENFVHGNGNEHRQIYHGAPKGYAQGVWSPKRFVLSAMQINLNDGSGTRGGPLPRFSRSYMPPNPSYNPLLECPCTTRTVKSLGGVGTAVSGTCSKAVLQNDCFESAGRVVSVRSNATVKDSALPSGCLLTRVQPGKDVFDAVFNTQTTSVRCEGSSDPRVAVLQGSAVDLVTLSAQVDGQKGLVTLTLTGPASVWFGVGFNASVMADQPYTIIVDGQGVVQERKLQDHAPGTVLNASVKVLSNTVAQGLRTVVLQRPLTGLTAEHYSFSPLVGTIPFINALGGTVNLTQHVKRASASLRLFRADTQPTCVCQSGAATINGIPFNAHCLPQPWSDLMGNPTCEVSTYVGGLSCCGNGVTLLDADQEVPPFVDEQYFKFRFYYNKYDPSEHELLYHVEWSQNGCNSGTSGPSPYGCSHIEFDVPKGMNSSLGPEIAVFTSHFPGKAMLANSCSPTMAQCMDLSKVGPGGIKLLMAVAHCHTPNCLKQELWNDDTGELLCSVQPVQGLNDTVYNEAGYVFTPPCTWGSADEGFRSPPIIKMNDNLRMVNYYNSTYGHPGQMGIWQMKAAFNN